MRPLDFLNIPEDTFNEPWFLEFKDKNPGPEIQRHGLFLSRLRSIALSIDALAIPNAGKSSVWQRLQRHREGTRRGALDLILAWNRSVMSAEFENGTGRPSKDQVEQLDQYHRMARCCGEFRKPDTLLAHLREHGAPFIGRLSA